MTKAAALFVGAVLLAFAPPAAATSERASREACAGLPLDALLREAAPRSAAALPKKVPGYAHTADVADKSLCSSISEPLIVIPEESAGFADRFCGVLRSELGRRGGAQEARLGGPAPGESATPPFGSCDFFAQDGSTTISARAVYMVQPDASTKVFIMVSAW